MVAEAGSKGDEWIPVHEFFTAPGLKDLAFDGKPENLSGIPRLVYEYLSAHSLQPRLFYTDGEGTLANCMWAGRYYTIFAQWPDTTHGDACR